MEKTRDKTVRVWMWATEAEYAAIFGACRNARERCNLIRRKWKLNPWIDRRMWNGPRPKAENGTNGSV